MQGDLWRHHRERAFRYRFPLQPDKCKVLRSIVPHVNVATPVKEHKENQRMNDQPSVTSTEIEIILEGLVKARTRLLDKTRRNRLLNFKESVRDIAIIDEMPNLVFSHLIPR